MKYPENCVVIDNPPFSFLASICDWYNENEIDFFLFSPYLTNFTARANHIITDTTITYENGAKVNTSFLTNLGNVFIESENEGTEKKERTQKKYPSEVLTSTAVGYLSKYGIEFQVKKNECAFIRSLDAQREEGTGTFGGGFLIATKAATRFKKAKEDAEKKSNKKEETWKLSEREQTIIDELGEN